LTINAVKLQKVIYYVRNITSLKLRHQNDVTKLFHFQAPPLAKSWLWWPNLTKDMQTEQLLCWSGMTDTGIVEHLAQTKKKTNKPRAQRDVVCNIVTVFCHVQDTTDE